MVPFQNSLAGLSQPLIEADFCGGTLTSNACALLIELAEPRLNLYDRLAAFFRDARNSDLAAHSCLAKAPAGGKADKAPSGKKLAKAMPETLRLCPLNIRTRVSVVRIRVAMSSLCPDKDIFIAAWMELMPP